ncbi:MAG TPA: ATP-binding protein, partial [Azospirillaceae bacterium]|nr:ATP-binding protein [Azospirillaceae bacterium]
SYAIGRYLTRSLRELEALAGTVIRKGLVDSRARVAGRDEAGRLAAAFNVMLDRLSEADAELRARARAEVEAQRANAAAAERARALAEQAGAEAEAARRQAERANAAKTKFLAAASHDLRQPFQSMRLFHHLLTGDPPPERRADALARLGEAMEAGEELLNALLDVSTLEAGQVTPKPQPVALEEVVAAEASQFAALAAEKGLRLRVAACRGAVMTDPILLKRMLRNLVANAVRYTERGGILVGCRRRGDRWRIEVWDTGIGIPEGQVRAIFEDFHQLGNPERDRSRGLGLGLSVVDRMARLLDHPVEVRSRPGRGSCFSISVPAVAEPAQPGAAPAGADAGPAARVLVVEDDAIQAIGLQMMLEDWGHRVERAPSGDAALEHVRAHGLPALLVTDYRLPGRLNGAALLREIRRLAGTSPAAVVVTGDTDPDCLREVARSGGVLLNKPYKAEALRRALADARAEAEQAQPATATGR